MPARFACSGVAGRNSAPPSSIRPDDAGRTPPTIFSSVLLPAPFAPTRPTILPAGTSKLTSRSASKSPNLLLMPVNDSAADVTISRLPGKPVPRRSPGDGSRAVQVYL